MVKSSHRSRRDSKTLKNVFSTPEFQAYQKGFEKRLGVYAYNHTLSYNAVNKGLNKMKNVMLKYYQNSVEEEEREKKILLKAFTSENITKAGQIGNDYNDLQKVLADTKPASPNTDQLDRGNLREKMTAFYNAAYGNNVDMYDNKPLNKDAQSNGDSFNFRAIMQDIMSKDNQEAKNIVDELELNSQSVGVTWKKAHHKSLFKRIFNIKEDTPDVYSNQYLASHSKDKEDSFTRNNLFRVKKRSGNKYNNKPADYAEQMSLPLSNREQNYQQSLQQSLGLDQKYSPVVSGKDKWSVNTKGFMGLLGGGNSLVNKRGFSMIAGISGTTAKLLNTYKWLGFSGDDLLNFRLAIIGWLLPEEDNSLYEILKGSHMVGVRGNEDMTDAYTMDASEISPLSKSEILDHCGMPSPDKLDPQGILPKYPENLLPFDEYFCSKFIYNYYNEDERKNDDDSKISLFAYKDSDIYRNARTNPNYNYLENISARRYSQEGHLSMNRKLSLGSFLFSLNLKHNLAKYFFEKISDFCTEDSAHLNKHRKITKASIVSQLKKKIKENFEEPSVENSDFRVLANEIFSKKSVIQEIQTEFDKLWASNIEPRLDSYERITRYDFIYIALKLQSFCKTTSRKIANKYVNKRLLQDIDELNFGVNQYLTNSAKHTGKVYSGQFMFKGPFSSFSNLNLFFNNKTYTAPCQISTSVDPNVAKHFLKDQTLIKQPCFLVINLRGFNAVDISNISTHRAEKEVLIPKGTKFSVDYVSSSGPRDTADTIPAYDPNDPEDKKVDKNTTYVYLTELGSRPAR